MARLKPNPTGPPGGRSDPAPTTDAGRGQLIQVATRCATLDEFVERFAAFAWEGSLVLPAASAVPIGTQGRFVILLRDQTVAMRGRCRVTEAKPTPVSSRNPAVKKIMMRVALLEMDEASRAVHRRLIALRSAPVPLPVPPEPSETTQIEPARQGSGPVRPPVAAPPVAAPPPVAAVPPIAAAPPAAAVPPVAVPAPPIKTASVPPVHLNRTMIGLGVGPDGKPFLPQAAPATPRLPTPPRIETRAPGAPDTLPANPLSEFAKEDVESFIECTLLEAGDEVGTGVAGAQREQVAAASAGAPVTARRWTAIVGLDRVLDKLPPPARGKVVRFGPYVLVAVVSLVIGASLSRKSAPPAVPARAPVAAAAPAPAPVARPPAPEPKIAPAVAPLVKVAVAEKAGAPSPGPSAPKGRGTEEKRAEPSRPATEASPPAAAPARDSQKVPAAGEGAADGDCTARVITQPKDAKVMWGERVIGRSPIEGARVPCDPATVTIERERWEPVTVEVSPDGNAFVVREQLKRPRGVVDISSSPPGAQISVNRVAAGPAPRQLDIQRYEKVTIKATLKGYQPWTKSLYLKDAEAKIDVELVPRK